MSRLLWLGAGCFGSAFLVWNIDNQFCDILRGWRYTVGLPIGAISEVRYNIKNTLTKKKNNQNLILVFPPCLSHLFMHLFSRFIYIFGGLYLIY